jgi:uncharacterized protein YxeA
VKKYKAINFLENDKKYDVKYFILIISIITLVFIYDYQKTEELNKLIQQNNLANSIPVMYYEDKSQIDKLEEVYNFIGKDNIISFTFFEENLLIKSYCISTDILDDIKNYKYVKSFYLDGIKKEGEVYIFECTIQIK